MANVTKLLLPVSLFLAFYPPSLLGAQADKFESYSIISRRNIFRPLWTAGPAATGNNAARKDEREALRKAEEERQRNQKNLEEQAALDNKKRDIEQRYALTGIISDNNRMQAVIQDKKGTTLFLYQNSTFDDLKLESIDQANGEATIDYQGKFTVTLHLE